MVFIEAASGKVFNYHMLEQPYLFSRLFITGFVQKLSLTDFRSTFIQNKTKISGVWLTILQKQPRRYSIKTDVLKNFAKFTGTGLQLY